MKCFIETLHFQKEGGTHISCLEETASAPAQSINQLKPSRVTHLRTGQDGWLIEGCLRYRSGLGSKAGAQETRHVVRVPRRSCVLQTQTRPKTASYVNLFSILCSLTSHQQFEIRQHGRIYTTETGAHYNSGLFPFFFWVLVVQCLLAQHKP